MELIKALFIETDFSKFLVNFEHLVELLVALSHLKDDTAALDRVITIGAAEQKLHGCLLQVVLVDVLLIDTHDMLVCLHLTELAHDDVECVLRIEIDQGQVINSPLRLVLAEGADQVLNLRLGEHGSQHFGNSLLSSQRPQCLQLGERLFRSGFTILAI